MDDRRGSLVVLGITGVISSFWIVAESALGFGGQRRSGIRDPRRGFPGLGLQQGRGRSPSLLEAKKGRVCQSPGKHVEEGVCSWHTGGILP